MQNPAERSLLLGSSWSQTPSLRPAKSCLRTKACLRPHSKALPAPGHNQAEEKSIRHHSCVHIWHLIVPFWSPKPKQQTCWLCSKEFECDLPVACWSHIRGLFGAYLHLAAGVTVFFFFFFLEGGALQQWWRQSGRRCRLSMKSGTGRCSWPFALCWAAGLLRGSLGNALAARRQVQPKFFATLLYGCDLPDPPKCRPSKAPGDKVIFWIIFLLMQTRSEH